MDIVAQIKRISKGKIIGRAGRSTKKFYLQYD